MGSGGRRTGAGRPKGIGKYGERTKAIRVPESLIDDILEFAANKGYKIPLYSSAVQAGGPSPADDHMDEKVDLNERFIKDANTTFFVKVKGDSMIKIGIHEDDTLIVDRSIAATHDKIIVAAVNGELTVKRLHRKNGEVKLMPENDDFSPIEISENCDIHIWGVVTNVVHAV